MAKWPIFVVILTFVLAQRISATSKCLHFQVLKLISSIQVLYFPRLFSPLEKVVIPSLASLTGF